MAKIFIVDGAGARATSLGETRARFNEATIAAFGQDIDLHAHTPQNQIAGINALVWTEVGEELLRAALYGASIDHAPGKFLDAFGSLLDIKRDASTYTRVTATLVGVSGTIVEAGSLARTQAGDEFASVDQVILSPSGVSVDFVATTPGAIPCEAGQLTDIVSVRSGWDSITNPEAGTIGRDEESDASYRANLKARTAHSSVGSLSALDSALRGAGATNIRIIENSGSASSTISGITIPAHSIFVIAEGGLYDDLVRALENHRTMGVGTFTGIFGKPVNLALTAQIPSGRLIYNGTSYSNINVSSYTTPATIASHLNTISGLPRFEDVGNSLMAFVSWTPTTTGFEDVSASISDSVPIRPGYFASETIILRGEGISGNTRPIWMFFDQPISFAGTGSISAKIIYDDNDGNSRELTISNFSLANQSDRMIVASIPVDSDGNVLHDAKPETIGIQFSATSTRTIRNAIGLDVTTGIKTPTVYHAIPFNILTDQYGFIFPTPGGDGALTLNAHCQGRPDNTPIDKWQYRRSQGGTDIDADWVDIPSSASSTIRASIPVTGIDRTAASTVSIQCVDGTGSSLRPYNISLPPVSTARPTLTNAIVDGSVIELTFNQELLPFSITSTPATSPFTVSVSNSNIPGFNINRMMATGTKVYIECTNEFTEANSAIRITYVPGNLSATNKLQGKDTGLLVSAFTDDVTNRTEANSPGRPTELIAIRNAGDGNVSLRWIANEDDGGSTIDVYEYSVSSDGGNTWGAWQSYTVPNSPTTPLTTSFVSNSGNFVRVRASNTAIRLLSALGFEGVSVDGPILRSVPTGLEITITMASSTNLIGDALEGIRDALIARVNAYSIGESIWVKDLEAVVESRPGTRVDAISVRRKDDDSLIMASGDARAFQRWTLSRDDITITFNQA